MACTPLEKYTVESIAAAIETAKSYAAAQDVPLTAERLAAALDMDLELFRQIAHGQYPTRSPGMQKKAALIRRADREATASVVEHAMRRGSGTNMHLLYLKNNAGYDKEKDKPDGKKEETAAYPPVLFIREEDISE